MATFKEGDWVRCVDATCTALLKLDAVYKVERASPTYVYVNGGLGMSHNRFEPWTPKIGERVRYKNTNYGEATVIELVGDSHVKVDTHGRYRICTEKLSDLEPLPVAAEAQPAAPAPLTIQAGKFYKTRDGRKVGPMVLSEYPWEAGAYRAVDSSRSITGQDWSIDGTFIVGSTSPLDLISEWPDTTATTTNTAATVDALDEEYGPGMRKERPWDRYRDVVADRDNDTVGLTVSLDTSELHEELDAVISKLKKIRELQRELGLIAA